MYPWLSNHQRAKHQRAAAVQQYAIIVGMIAVLAILAVTSIGGGVKALMTRTSNSLSNVVGGGSGGAVASAPASTISIVANGVSRNYADGSFAGSCNDYLNPAPGYAYNGLTGDGIYSIKPIGQPSPFQVYCNMTDSGGGWTLVMKQASGDGITLQGDTAYWTNGGAGVLNDVTGSQNEANGNFVSKAFTTVAVSSQLMLKASNESTFKFQSGSYSSPFAAFSSVTNYVDDCNSVVPDWYIHATTFPNPPTNTVITSARFGFNFKETYGGSQQFCSARWGWAANQNGCDLALSGSHDSCGGLGTWGPNGYGSTWMNSNRNAWQPATLYLYAK